MCVCVHLRACSPVYIYVNIYITVYITCVYSLLQKSNNPTTMSAYAQIIVLNYPLKGTMALEEFQARGRMIFHTGELRSSSCQKDPIANLTTFPLAKQL